MNPARQILERTAAKHPNQAHGSAMVLATFVLAMLTGMGVALLFLSRTELELSKADMRIKTSFYLAESGLEHGRSTLLATYGDSDLSDILATVAVDDSLDFDPDNLIVHYDAAGEVTSLTGYGDDLPVADLTAVEGGWYAAFLSNDPEDGVHNVADGNDRLMLTGVGLGAGGSLEMVQALVDPDLVLPYPPATVLLLGPTPDFEGGGYPSDEGGTGGEGDGDDDDNDDDEECVCHIPPGNPADANTICGGGGSIAAHLAHGDTAGACGEEEEEEEEGESGYSKAFIGSDCGGSGLPGLFVPVIGTVDSAAAAGAEAGLWPSDPGPTVVNEFTSSSYADEDTVADLSDSTEPTVIGAGYGTLDETWGDCLVLVNRVEELRSVADTECSFSCSLPVVTEADSVTFIDGDLSVGDGESGSGLLVVTGRLEFHAGASWSGLIVVLGEGEFVRTGDEGDGEIVGATIVGDIAGPDDSYGTADDCTGGSAGFDSVVYHEADRAAGDTVYCTTDIDAALPLGSFEVVQFRQR